MRLNKPLMTFALAVFSPLLLAQQNDKTLFFIGHSLVNLNMPAMVHGLAMDAGVGRENDYNTQVINGAPLRWNWQNGVSSGTGGQGVKATTVYGREALATGSYNVVVMTEGIPLGLDMVEYGGNFHTLAHTSNPNAQTYMFESWHWVTPNPTYDLDPIRYFNENTRAEYRIDTNNYDQIDLLRRHKPLWEEKVDAINAAYPQHPDMQIIPAGQVLLRVNEAIVAGDVPGITNIEQLFSDNIHMNDIGNYLVALTHFAVIYNRSPLGLTNQLKSEWGVNFTAPTPEQATVFQQLVWEVVNGTPPAPHPISLVLNPNHAGTLTCTPNPVPHGENATCTVDVNRGLRFTGFSDDCSGTTCVLTNVTSPKRITANFSPVPVANDTLPFLDGFE